MGPLSLILRAPFAALSHLAGDGGGLSGYENAYRLGVVPMVFAGGVLGLVLAELMRGRGRPRLERIGVVTLCMLNPVAIRAIDLGHPEEIFGAALVTGAAVAGLYGRVRWMAVLLVAALLNKQWAGLAILPLVLAAPWHEARRALAAVAAVVGAIAVALFAVNPDAFLHINGSQLDIGGEAVQPASVWWPFTEQIPGGREGYHDLPEWLARSARPLLIGVALAVPLLLARRVREDPVGRVLPLLALVLLIRCVLDPVNTGYYHVPFFVALLAADALRGSLAPTFTATAALTLLTAIKGAPGALNAVYLAWALPFTAYLVVRAGGFRTSAARGAVASPSA